MKIIPVGILSVDGALYLGLTLHGMNKKQLGKVRKMLVVIHLFKNVGGTKQKRSIRQKNRVWSFEGLARRIRFVKVKAKTCETDRTQETRRCARCQWEE